MCSPVHESKRHQCRLIDKVYIWASFKLHNMPFFVNHLLINKLSPKPRAQYFTLNIFKKLDTFPLSFILAFYGSTFAGQGITCSLNEYFPTLLVMEINCQVFLCQKRPEVARSAEKVDSSKPNTPGLYHLCHIPKRFIALVIANTLAVGFKTKKSSWIVINQNDKFIKSESVF